MDDVPDYIDPVEGWRVWAVVNGGGRPVLRSLFFNAVWQPGVPMHASCEQRRFSLRTPWRRTRMGHDSPQERCHCGIHASFRVDTVMPYFNLHGPREYCRAIGRVGLWGDVVECELGYRAQSAYPTQLYVPEPRRSPYRPRLSATTEELLHGLAAYGVPVELLPADVEAPLEPLLPPL